MQTALSLVCYESELHKAMEWVFGTSFVCQNMDVAKHVAFHNNVMRKCVTLDGDVFDPAGTLTGGVEGFIFHYIVAFVCVLFEVSGGEYKQEYWSYQIQFQGCLEALQGGLFVGRRNYTRGESVRLLSSLPVKE